MEHVKGFNFEPFCARGVLGNECAFENLRCMKEETGANFVIFAPNGVQNNAHSEEIVFDSVRTSTDGELIDTIKYAKSIGLKVGIKPTVNCLDDTWRAYVSFFEYDVVCEPKWSNWFASYERFQTHYARIAEETGCDMFIAGCEMVMTEHREIEWRRVISSIRDVYKGVVTYNTDKYQEDHIKWWDAVDVIASSGYYPKDDWENQLDRIEKVAKQFKKEVVFTETGCMSVTGSSKVPNNWEVEGNYNEREQSDWYKAMFEACDKRPWLKGYVLWDWRIYSKDVEREKKAHGYGVWRKEAMQVVRKFFRSSYDR